MGFVVLKYFFFLRFVVGFGRVYLYFFYVVIFGYVGNIYYKVLRFSVLRIGYRRWGIVFFRVVRLIGKGRSIIFVSELLFYVWGFILLSFRYS